MATQIHAAGATGAVSPGLAIAIEDALTDVLSETVDQSVQDYLTANPPAGVVDATAGTKGVIQLTGDLGGTAAAPTVPGLADKVDKANIPLNVVDYGATGDGITDDTSAIQAAISAAAAAGRDLYIPRGDYLTTSPLTITANAVTIRGAGRDASVINFTGSGYAMGASAPAANLSRWSLSDFTIDTRGASAGAVGLHLDNVGRSTYERLRLRCTVTAGDGVAVKLIGGEDAAARSTYFNTFIDVEAAATGKVVELTGYANANRFIGGIFEGAGVAVYCEQGSASNNIGTCSFINVGIQTSNAVMVQLGIGSGSVSNVTGFQFLGCRFEATTPVQIVLHPNAIDTFFSGGSMSGDVTFADTGVFSTILATKQSTFKIGGEGKKALTLPYATAGITIGGDDLVNLYRRIAGTMHTDGDFEVGGTKFKVGQGAATGLDVLGAAITASGTNATVNLPINPKGSGRLYLNSLGTTSTGGTLIEGASGKLAFFGGTVTSKPTGTPTDATDLASAIALVNDLKAKLVSLGLIA